MLSSHRQGSWSCATHRRTAGRVRRPFSFRSPGELGGVCACAHRVGDVALVELPEEVREALAVVVALLFLRGGGGRRRARAEDRGER
eukprot:7652769-Pyramimonas_sp.AAC.1